MIKLLDLLKEIELPSASPVSKSDVKILFYRSSGIIKAKEGDKEVTISNNKENRDNDLNQLINKIDKEGDFKLTDGKNVIIIPKDAKYYLTSILRDKSNFR